MAGVSKMLALAAAGSAVVGVMADAMGPSADMAIDATIDAELMAVELMAVGTGYKGYVGQDYIPLDDADAVAANIGSALVESAAECAEACEAMEGCNGASYYPDPVAYFGKEGMKNCWLKTFTATCAPPAEAVMDDMAVLLLKPSADCPADVTMEMAMAPEAGAPMAAAPMGVAEGPIEAGTREFTTDESGSISLRSAASALAVAGAILALA